MKVSIKGVCYDTSDATLLYEETVNGIPNASREVYITGDGKFFFLDVEKRLSLPSEKEEAELRKSYLVP